MARYSFSMEKVLEWRTNIEKTNMEKFAVLQNELQHQKLILEQFMRDLDLINGKGYKNIQELKHQHYYKQNMEEKIKKQTELIHKTSENLESARLELISAQKDRKIMEKLKEKDFTLYKDNIKTMEQKELDEMAVLKFKKVKNE